MSNVSFPKFPDNVLEVIFSQVPKEQLLKELTLVSPRFNQVISNSLFLLRHVKFNWDSRKVAPTRKYTRINFIDSIATPQLQKFIQDRPTSFTSMGFDDCAFTRSKLYEILSSVAANLKELSFDRLRLMGRYDMPLIEMPNLEQFKVLDNAQSKTNTDYWSFLFASLVTPNLKSLIYSVRSPEMLPEEAQTFAQFLVAQSKLESISLSANATKALVNHSASFPFHASRINLDLTSPDGPVNKDFSQAVVKFLETQKESLAHLTLKSCVLDSAATERILGLSALKDLQLFQGSLLHDRKIEAANQSLTRIKFSFVEVVNEPGSGDNKQAVANILECCKALESVDFGRVAIHDETWKVLAGIKTLRKLKFDACTVKAVSLPTVEELVIVNCDKQNVVELIGANKQLKSVVVDRGCQEDEKFQALSKGLKSLSISFKN